MYSVVVLTDHDPKFRIGRFDNIEAAQECAKDFTAACAILYELHREAEDTVYPTENELEDAQSRYGGACQDFRSHFGCSFYNVRNYKATILDNSAAPVYTPIQWRNSGRD